MTYRLSLAGFRPLVVAALVAASTAGGLAHSDPAERQFHNGTFGYGLDLAGGLLADYDAVVSPDGITLTSPDGGAVVNVFGSWNEAGRSLAAIVEEYKRGLPDASFTYEWRGRNAAVVSGYQDGDVFYVRIAMSRDRRRVAVLNMIYASELKPQLDPVVTRLSRSLTIR